LLPANGAEPSAGGVGCRGGRGERRPKAAVFDKPNAELNSFGLCRGGKTKREVQTLIFENMMNLLQAAAGQPQQPSPWGFYIMIGLMILVLWLFMWRPESKRRKEMQKFREGLKKGDKVITAGGIYGTVKEIKERTLLIEVDGNVTLRVDKNMVVADTTDLQK
jgi:preprotein translocase subunit YajC